MKALIADGHWISRAGLSHLLSLLDASCSVTEAASFAEAEAALTAHTFDICVLDPAMNDSEPAEGIRRLRAAAPATPIAIVSDRESRRFALEVIELGAQGFILKSATAEEIRRAIERVLAGEIALPANLRDLPQDHGHGRPEAAAPFVSARGHNPEGRLTLRQRDVLGLIAVGKRNAEIGKELDISPRTVQIHVSTILKLLGVGNRTEAALLARKYGMGV